MREQIGVLHHTARAIYHNLLWEISEKLTNLMKYDKVLMTNTGKNLNVFFSLAFHMTTK